HYVHHQPDGRPYADPNVMSEAILQAGHATGIRVVLLMTAYAQSGFNQPPEEGQLRFCDASVEAFLERVEALRVTGVPNGIAPYAELLAANIPLAIGSDSNTRLDPIEELRWAEYTARMRYQRRRVLVSDEMASPGPLLLSYGTQCGAKALGLETGTITPGM